MCYITLIVHLKDNPHLKVYNYLPVYVYMLTLTHGLLYKRSTSFVVSYRLSCVCGTDPVVHVQILHLDRCSKNIPLLSLSFLKERLPVLVRPLSAIQPFSYPLALHVSPPGHWATLGTIDRVSLGRLLHSWFCKQLTHGAQEGHTCTDTTLSGNQFTPWSSGVSEIHFLCPEQFTLNQW